MPPAAAERREGAPAPAPAQPAARQIEVGDVAVLKLRISAVGSAQMMPSGGPRVLRLLLRAGSEGFDVDDEKPAEKQLVEGMLDDAISGAVTAAADGDQGS